MKKEDGEYPRPRSRTSKSLSHDSARSDLGAAAITAEAVRHPGHWNHEERREKETEQRVEPDEGDVEAAEPNADPKGA